MKTHCKVFIQSPAEVLHKDNDVEEDDEDDKEDVDKDDSDKDDEYFLNFILGFRFYCYIFCKRELLN